VPGGPAALAAALAIDPVPDRGRFMSEVTRLVYQGELHGSSTVLFLDTVRRSAKNRLPMAAIRPSGQSDLVPVPLSADIWGDAIFHRRVARDELVLSIVSDPQAALLCYGLSQLDDETLGFMAGHPSLLSHLYERSGPMFAAFSGSVRVRDNRVVPPGDAEAAPLWEAVVGERVTRPDRFVSALFELNEGRLAYLYDTIGQLDPPRRAFAVGSWIPDAAMRLARFKLLATAGLSSLRDWHTRSRPFARSSYDLGMTFLRLEVREDGAPVAPASRGFWSRVFGAGDTSDAAPIDAAWLAENVAAVDLRQRGDRVDQIGFAQRVFAQHAGDQADLVLVVRSFPRMRALMLTFERARLTTAATYAVAVRHVARLSVLDGRRGYVAQAQLQGCLVLVSRMAGVGTLDVPTLARLIERLMATPLVEGNGYGGGIAKWLRDDLYPVLPPSKDFESAVIAGLAGRSAPADAQRVTWEGQQYRLDLAAAERNRLRRVREKQLAPALDLSMQLSDALRLLLSDKVTLDDLQDVATQFSAIAADLPQRSREEEADSVPAGVAPPPAHRDVLRRAADELTKAARSRDLKRAPHVAGPLVDIADDLLARNLLSYAYAISLGDPEGTILLADDVSHRHDFGFGLRDGDLRARLVWAVPRQQIAPNMPWHVSGSLLGLDAALSGLALRRVSTDHVLEPPRLTTNARDTFAMSVSLLDPIALRDADRDAIADAIARGRQRALEATDPQRLDALATELSIDGARRRALRWTLAHEPERLLSMVSLTELLALGGARADTLHAWGMAVVAANGCLCSRLMAPGGWALLSGRPQLGLAASVLPDLNLRVAVLLKELGLPAPLAKVVLSGAMQDFIDEARPTDDDDWLSLSRTARALTRERIEDYVAAATAVGPLMPDARPTPEQEP
jgi:hypothetical protein